MAEPKKTFIDQFEKFRTKKKEAQAGLKPVSLTGNQKLQGGPGGKK